MSLKEVEAALLGLLLRDESQRALVAANPHLASKAIVDGKVNWKQIDVGIEHHGSKITLPAEPLPMSIDDGIDALQRKKKDLETEVSVHEVIDAFPLDGAVAFMKALQRIYGWANSVPTPGFFGPKPPQMITVDVGPGPADKIQVPWGGFQIPGVSHPIYTGNTETSRGAALVIYGTVRKRDVDTLKKIAEMTRDIVKNESIYRGKAIRLRSASASTADVNNPPQFMDLAAAKIEELVLPRQIENLINVNVWTLIEKTQRCLEARIPLKRGVLLAGKYGTGKTLCSLMTAKKCVDNGWTFISLDRAQALHQTLEFARRYEPAVIFAEDIDRAAADRNESTNDLLNIMDGVLSKSSQIMVVMTTNHVEKINQAMLRPGRLDAVIVVSPPDSEAAQRLLRIYGRGLIRDGENLDHIGKELSGNIPAMIREVVERSKLAAIALGEEYVTEPSLLVAAAGMRQHMDLLAEPTAKTLSAEEALGAAIARVVGEQVTNITAKSTSMVMEVLEQHEDMNPGEVVDDNEAGTVFKDGIAKMIAPPKAITNGHAKVPAA